MSKHMQRLYIIFHKIYDIVTCIRIKARFSTAGLQNRALKNTGSQRRDGRRCCRYIWRCLTARKKKNKFESLYFTYRRKLMFPYRKEYIERREGLAEDAVHQAFLSNSSREISDKGEAKFPVTKRGATLFYYC